MSNRAGEFVKQPSGYKAFIPKDLPPEPQLDINANMQALLSRADHALGRLDGSIQTLPDQDVFIIMYKRKEAVLSSQIEGTQSSLSDLLEEEASIFNPDRPRDVEEVINYIVALNHGLARLPSLPISTRLFCEIHELLLKGVRGADKSPGQLREKQNYIGPKGALLHEATYVPPPPNEVPKALSALEKFIHYEEGFPALIAIGLVHAQFETIHPFLDGNGRIGRLMITLLLCEKGRLQKPVLYLSHYFTQNRQRYYELLQGIHTTGDWESWINFFLEGVAVVAEEATNTACSIVSLREKHRSLIVNKFGGSAANALKVLERLFSLPIISVKEVEKLTGASYTTANTLVRELVENRILFETTGQARNRRYYYVDYIRLFDQ